MESTSIDFISFWPTASSTFALRLCTLKALTKIGRLISATSSGRTLVNFETKSSRSAFGASAMNFCARVNTSRKRFAASVLALSQLSLANIAVMSNVGDIFLVRVADHTNIAGLLQDREERLHRPHRIQPVLH